MSKYEIEWLILVAPGEIVEGNFGSKPFEFDIETYFAEQKVKTMEMIDQVELPAGLDVNEIVLAYLVHNGFSETARKFMDDSRCAKVKKESVGGGTHMESRRGLISLYLYLI